MKTKIPILTSTFLLIAFVSIAQYPGAYSHNQVVVQGQIQIPGKAFIAYGYNNYPRYDKVERDVRRDRKYDERYGNRRDWREIEYERYCRDHRNFRMSREDFYRSQCNYQPYFPPKRVICH